MAVKGGLLL